MNSDQPLMVIAMAPLIGAILTFFAYKKGFFHYSDTYDRSRAPKFIHVLIAFVLFFIVQLIVGYSMLILWKDSLTKYQLIYAQALVQGVALLASGIPLILYSLTKKVRSLWGKLTFSSMLIGLLAWFIIIPWVVFLSEGGTYLIEHFFKSPLVDQDPVRYLKELASYPGLFLASAITIVTLIPVCEEILFRGFLQTWLCRYFPLALTIVITSLIFTAFHFSMAQGLSNLGLLPPLFLLSCFLCFLRAKTNSLLSSITLHSLFNGINIIMLIFS